MILDIFNNIKSGDCLTFYSYSLGAFFHRIVGFATNSKKGHIGIVGRVQILNQYEKCFDFYEVVAKKQNKRHLIKRKIYITRTQISFNLKGVKMEHIKIKNGFNEEDLKILEDHFEKYKNYISYSYIKAFLSPKNERIKLFNWICEKIDNDTNLFCSEYVLKILLFTRKITQKEYLKDKFCDPSEVCQLSCFK